MTRVATTEATRANAFFEAEDRHIRPAWCPLSCLHRCSSQERDREGGIVNRRRLLLRILNGSRNVAFAEFVNLIEGSDFA